MFEYNMYQLMFLFFLFCNIGWVLESTIESLYRQRLINRGFLKGPYIPLYGFGGMTILLCCMPFAENGFATCCDGCVRLLSCELYGDGIFDENTVYA